MDGLRINLQSASYAITFADNATLEVRKIFEQFNKAGRKSVLLTDENLQQSCAGLIAEAFADLPRLALPAGEKTKSLEYYGRVLDYLAANRVDRTGVLWVLGGGVIGDLGGFAAATYLRGVEFIQVPTTLLAMVDSSIGGKTGINLPAGKNLVGAFHHPGAVVIAAEFLRTLPPREFAAGMAEVIKYGLLGDAEMFDRLECMPLTPAHAGLLPVIRRCCELKAAIVQADERETAPENGRALLNLGHTFGHAVEQVSGYGSYLHGEAVAVGLAGAVRLSHKLGYLQAAAIQRVEATLAAHALPVRLRAALPLAALMSAMRSDKKVRAGRLRFVVLPGLGRAATRSDIEPAMVEAVWRELGAA